MHINQWFVVGVLYLWRKAGKAPKKWRKTGKGEKNSAENQKREVCRKPENAFLSHGKPENFKISAEMEN